jgi:hypothetical protein
VISAENKRNGRVQVIEKVIRRMEAGMERWGVPVPPRDADEKTELALVVDDAEYEPDPDASNGASSPGASAGSAGSAGAAGATRPTGPGSNPAPQSEERQKA